MSIQMHDRFCRIALSIGGHRQSKTSGLNKNPRHRIVGIVQSFSVSDVDEWDAAPDKISMVDEQHTPNQVEDLLRLAEAGDRAAFVQLFDRDREKLKRMVCLRMDRRLSSRIDASDAIQEAWLFGRQWYMQYQPRYGATAAMMRNGLHASNRAAIDLSNLLRWNTEK
jgi:hypothetical protein